MRPLKTYVFQDVMNSNIQIVIKAYFFEPAYEILVSVTKHPSDFKLIE